MTDETSKTNNFPDIQSKEKNTENHKQFHHKPISEKERQVREVIIEELNKLIKTVPRETIKNKKIEKIIDQEVKRHQKTFYIALGFILGPFIFLILAIYSGLTFSYYNEKVSLDKYKEKLAAELKGESGSPDLQLLNIDNQSLSENTKINVIGGYFVKKDMRGVPYESQKYRLIFPIQFFNKGDGIPKNVAIRAYFSSLSQYEKKSFSVDVGQGQKYDMIAHDVIESHGPVTRGKFLNILPKDERFVYQDYLDLDVIPKDGSYDAEIKVFYGDNYSKSTSAKFKLVVDRSNKAHFFENDR